MSVRLFHEHTRLVVRIGGRGGASAWYALHRRPVAWPDVFGPALRLVGFAPEHDLHGLSFGGGSVRWTRGWFGTAIRLQLPPCSERKAALLAAGLLKAARYAGGQQVPERSGATSFD